MSETCPEFFKIYIPKLSSERLRIPPAFIKKFNGTLSKNVILKDLTRKKWHVQLEKVEKNWFIQNGWHDFVTDYSLEYGDFLLFSYSQNSIFNVKLFGKDGCMKESDSAIVEIKKEENLEAGQTDCRFPRACKRKSSQAIRTQNIGTPYLTQCKASIAAINVEKHMVLMPKYPHFVAVMTRCNRYDLHIPSRMLKDYGINLKPAVVLRDQSGMQWPMKVTIRNDGRSAFTAGWSDFRKCMKLELQDKCVFELILVRGKICKEGRVQIIRATPRNQKNIRYGSSRKRG